MVIKPANSRSIEYRLVRQYLDLVDITKNKFFFYDRIQFAFID